MGCAGVIVMIFS